MYTTRCSTDQHPDGCSLGHLDPSGACCCDCHCDDSNDSPNLQEFLRYQYVYTHVSHPAPDDEAAWAFAEAHGHEFDNTRCFICNDQIGGFMVERFDSQEYATWADFYQAEAIGADVRHTLCEDCTPEQPLEQLERLIHTGRQVRPQPPARDPEDDERPCDHDAIADEGYAIGYLAGLEHALRIVRPS